MLDVACGTGVVARATARDRLAGNGTVVGVDLNEAMLTVARRLDPGIDWRQGDAGALPFPDDSFDVVLCTAGTDVLSRPGAGAPGDGQSRPAGRHRCGSSAGVHSTDAWRTRTMVGLWPPATQNPRMHGWPEGGTGIWVMGR